MNSTDASPHYLSSLRSIYVFVGLERTGGWMCWDVTNAEAPVFQVTAVYVQMLC